MKTLATLAIAFLLVPVSFSAAAEPQTASVSAQLDSIERQIAHLRTLILARVLGAATSDYFTVTSNGNVIAQSYVPVTASVAKAWCADMAAMSSFKNTAIVCTHNGTTI